MKTKVGISLTVFFLLLVSIAYSKERSGIVTFTVDLSAHADAGKIRLWLPYPLSDEHQVIEDMEVTGSFSHSAVYREPESGATYLYAEWDKKPEKKILEMRFRVKSLERKTEELKETDAPIPPEVLKYLKPNHWIPTDGVVKEIADKITRGKRGILEKSRAVYDWVVENTFRDPDVKGCGLGEVEQMLVKRGGKCADISSVYVAIARAAGVPAREVFGLRLGKRDDQDITKGHHCWAEFYLPGTGWVQVDPADVRKMMLVKKLSLKEAEPYREYFFGAVDEYRIVLERGGRGIHLIPRQQAGPLNYFMYPYAEVDGKPLDYFEPGEFRYAVHFKAE